MERTIIIVSTRTQQKYVLNSKAETLGDLKKECDAQGIDYTDLSWYEGLSKSELINDASILPHDLPYKGTTTNNLVFRLTYNKKISSGVYNRKECYEILKDNYDLQELIKKEQGYNYTNVSTVALNNIIEKHLPKEVKVKEQKSNIPSEIDALLTALSHIYPNLAFSVVNIDNNSPYSDAEIDEILK
jgi:hypothetical protein